jgi:hypothetical protein
MLTKLRAERGRLLLVMFGLAALGACASPGPTSAARAETVDVAVERARPATSAPPPPEAAIVWIADRAAALGVTSVWLEPGGATGAPPREIARRSGPVVAVGATLVGLVRRERHAPLADCDACNAGTCTPSGQTSSGAGLDAVDLRTGQVRDLTPGEQDGPTDVDTGLGDFESDVEVTGAVGSVVFFRGSGTGYGCGAAHPFFFSKAAAFDLASAAEAPLAPPSRIEADMSAEAKRVLVAEHGDCLLEPDSAPTLFEIAPKFDEHGALRASYTWIMGAPYVCGVGPDHYSVDATLDDRDPPAGLGFSRAHDWLRPAFEHRAITGVSMVDAAARDALANVFERASP